MSKALGKDLLNKRFLGRAATTLLAWVGLVAGVGQLSDWAFQLSKHTWWSPLVFWASLIGLPLAIWRSWPRPIEETYQTPRTRIRVLKGDLFDQGAEHLVITTCDTFDTAIPNIIALGSVQGQALQRIYNGDAASLDADLTAALTNVAPVATVQKAGKTSRYPIGTVATIRQPGRNLYFVAITMMSQNNTAQGTPDGLWTSLNRLWEAINQSSNDRPVCMPVIGTGLSRMSNILSIQDALRFAILSFMFASRQNPVCGELRIVLRPEDYERLDRLELQAFLTSLKPS
ncbi:macro domain-containing protein [Mycobacterium sp. E2462]|uniref:macro domain-containing protein n=1 Tax=Mycobacterium sp. E2462 TaxID=1834133 RepID=UPI000AED06BA|nr:macro domain-containing protein [Mycobacterium sp. E2462]